MANEFYRYVAPASIDATQVQITVTTTGGFTYLQFSLVNPRDLVFLNSIEVNTIIGFKQNGIDRGTAKTIATYDETLGFRIEGAPTPALIEGQYYEVALTAARPADQIPTPVENRGWSPVLAAEADGNRRVLRVANWVSGQGTKPQLGYIGARGIVANKADAVNIAPLESAGVLDEITANYTVLVNDEAALLPVNTTNNAVTVTLPDLDDIAVPGSGAANKGWFVSIAKISDANTLTVTGHGTDTINGLASITLSKQSAISVMWVGTRWIIRSDAGADETNDLIFTNGLKETDGTVEIDETAFDDTITTSFYTGAGGSQPNENNLFALSNADGSTFYQIQNSIFDFQSLSAPGLLWINDSQGDHIGAFGTDGTKTAPSYADDNILIIQAANPLTPAAIQITLSSGPVAYQSNGNNVGKRYAYDAISVDTDFVYDDSDSYRVSIDKHPVIQILAGSVKGGDQRWVNLSGANLPEFLGAPTHLVVEDATGIKEQPYDDFQKLHANVDTIVRFLAIERQGNNLATPAAGYFSMHSDVGGVTPITWTAKNARQLMFLRKFLKKAQVLQFGGLSNNHIRLVADATFSGSTASFDAVVTGTVPAVGQINEMYSLGRDLAQIYVTRQAIEGKETDRYASYTNAFIAASDRRGSVCLFTTATGPPTDTDAVGQPDIADRETNGIIAFGATLRTDKDPNNLVWDSTPNVANDYQSGGVLYVSVWNTPEARLKVTLTSAGTLVGSGNSAYIWATATWDEVNDIPDVTEVGNYFKIAEYEPSDLDVRIAATDVLDPFWLNEDGTNISDVFRAAVPTGTNQTDADLTADTTILLKNFDGVTLAEFFQHHDQSHVGITFLESYIFKTGTDTPDAGDVAFSTPLPDSQNANYYIKPKTDDDKALLEKILIANKKVRFEVDATRYVEFVPTGSPGELFGRLVGTYTAASFRQVGTALTNNHAVKLGVLSNIAARDEFADQAFSENSPNIAGGGGAAGQIWAWITSVTNAAWKSVVGVLLDAVAPTRADSDRGKLLALKSDDKNALELIDAPVALPDQTGHGGEFLHTDGTTADWKLGLILNFYDSDETTDNAQRTVQDTDAIQGPSLSVDGILSTEDISGFGRIYKTAALKSIDFTYTMNATQGVAFQLRYSDTKPTASSDAKTFGTQCHQANANAEGTCLEYDTPANRYWWFALSGGTSRIVNKRDVQVRAAFQESATPKSSPAVSDGLTVTSSDQDFITNIEAGDVYTVVFIGSKSALDSGQEFNDSLMMVWDKLASGSFRAAPAFTARLAGSNDGVLAGNELVIFTKDETNNKIQVRYNSTAWSGITLKLYYFKVLQ